MKNNSQISDLHILGVIAFAIALSILPLSCRGAEIRSGGLVTGDDATGESAAAPAPSLGSDPSTSQPAVRFTTLSPLDAAYLCADAGSYVAPYDGSVVLAACVADTNQQWLIADGRARIHGTLCLDAGAQPFVAGAPIGVAVCDADKAGQLFVPHQLQYQLGTTGLCLGLSNAAITLEKLTLAACNSTSASTAWSAQNLSMPVGTSSQIRAMGNDLACLTAAKAASSSIALTTCTADAALGWALEANRLVYHGASCLTRLASGAAAMQACDTGNQAQDMKVSGPTIIHTASASCLALSGDGSTEGTLKPSSFVPCAQSPNQSWAFLPATQYADLASAPKAPKIRPPLTTSGNAIIDAQGKSVIFVGANWFGADDGLFVPGGLDVRPRKEIAELIRLMGFNVVRLPFANEMVMRDPLVTVANGLAANSDLVGLHALDVYEAVVAALNDAGVAVILDNHITQARFCCDTNPCDAKWYNDDQSGCPVTMTTAQWSANWLTMVERFAKFPMVIGADLRNEVRNSTPWTEWAPAAEACGNAIHQANPNLLIVVEGVNYALDLEGAKARPITLQAQDKLIYSAHGYSFDQSDPNTAAYLARAIDKYGFIASATGSSQSPVWIGEFGGPIVAKLATSYYIDDLSCVVRTLPIGLSAWALNTYQSSAAQPEGYSILNPNWTAPYDDYRMRFLWAQMPTP